MVSQRLDTARIKALFANPLKGLLLGYLTSSNSRGDKVAPRPFGITSVGKQQDVVSLAIRDLDGEEASGVSGDAHERYATIAKQVVRSAERTHRTVPLKRIQVDALPPDALVAHGIMLNMPARMMPNYVGPQILSPVSARRRRSCAAPQSKTASALPTSSCGRGRRCAAPSWIVPQLPHSSGIVHGTRGVIRRQSGVRLPKLRLVLSRRGKRRWWPRHCLQRQRT